MNLSRNNFVIGKSRYNIKYLASKSISFYLAGATFENRQTIVYPKLFEKILFKIHDENNNTFEHIVFKSHLITFEQNSDQPTYINVLASFDDVVLNLGVIPNEEGFATDMYKRYLYLKSIGIDPSINLKIGSIKLNAWNGNIILIRIIASSAFNSETYIEGAQKEVIEKNETFLSSNLVLNIDSYENLDNYCLSFVAAKIINNQNQNLINNLFEN